MQTTYKENVFAGTNVSVDGADFHGCTFKGSVLVYAGGALPRFSDCVFEGCVWKFEGPAERTVTFIRAFSQAMGPEGQTFLENLFVNPPAPLHGANAK